MKLPERLVGFVNYGDTKYPFEFDKESFYLNLYPPTTEIWDETSSFREFFRSFEKNEKKHIGHRQPYTKVEKPENNALCVSARRNWASR